VGFRFEHTIFLHYNSQVENSENIGPLCVLFFVQQDCGCIVKFSFFFKFFFNIFYKIKMKKNKEKEKKEAFLTFHHVLGEV
jgi:hypothetical protein